METTKRRQLVAILFSLLLFVFAPIRAWSHPMGNFSVNHYGRIKIGQKSVEILYLIDMAEIPTYQDMRQFGMTTEPVNPANVSYLGEQETQLRKGLTVECDGQAVTLTTLSRQMRFAEGAGGLPTMKLEFVFRGDLDVAADTHKLSYADNNFPGRAGWKEIVVVSDGVTQLQSNAPQVDRSSQLSNYSTDLLNSPPQQLSAAVDFRTAVSSANDLAAKNLMPANPAANRDRGALPAMASAGKQHTVLSSPLSGVARLNPREGREQSSRDVVSVSVSGSASSRESVGSQNTPRSRFTQLISTQNKLGFWVLLSAAFIAAGLGALHALEPGHGKTIVAAYLVGSRGTARHAVLLGIVVTAAHTAGVYLLGIVTLYASRYIVPEQLYPWLGAISGLSVTALGGFIFLRHLTGESGEHSHAPGERHSHWFLSMFKRGGLQQTGRNPAVAVSSEGARESVSLRELCVLGITGGIVPCPAALVVLLSAFSLHRIGFGLFLITAFSVGLATVLVIVGLSMVYAKRFMSTQITAKSALVRRLPLFSAAVMVVLGLGIAVSAFASAPIGRNLLTKDTLVPFVTVTLLGLFLGMRHSTDPDHVVAVSTIVSRQRSMKSSATIGLLWGLGHTLTIFLVGSAIIIFGVVIPPRLGLSMEFCVALMLILLGILNLTGVMQWITERFTPAKTATDSMPGNLGNFLSNDESEMERFSRQDQPLFGRTVQKLGLYQTLRPLVIGLVHGLAGSAAVALLVLSTIKNPFWSTAYLLVFGIGTMAGMMLMTAAISAPLIFAGKKFSSINRHLTAISGMASVAFGMFLVYQIGFVDGLFTSHVHWIPQ
jgi:ABC-type nickel/cobalt efflux system permease component RcnA